MAKQSTQAQKRTSDRDHALERTLGVIQRSFGASGLPKGETHGPQGVGDG